MSDECESCGQEVDEDGMTTSDCPVVPTAQCDECYRCYCDGAC